MAGVWGVLLISTRRLFSDQTKEIIIECLPEARKIFAKEYQHALNDKHHYMLHRSERYYDDQKIIRVLETNFDEDYFIANKNRCLDQVLLGACSTDYYYTYEKEW
jgi:hypothetical protein